MPKITKTTKKASAASGKKSGLSKKFSLGNRKVQFFVFIAIVAILGGGYYTVRSFAATQYSATVTNGKLLGTNTEKYSNQSKNIINVLRTKSGGGTVYATLPVPANRTVKVCYNAKADQAQGAFFYAFTGNKGGGKGGIPAANTIIGTDFKSYCISTNTGSGTSLFIGLTNKVYGQENPAQSMYVSQLDVVY